MNDPAIFGLVKSADFASLVIRVEPTKEVLRITPDGTVMRHGQPLDSLSPEELRTVIAELIDLLRKR